jgi:two-component system OmpR family response regulator
VSDPPRILLVEDEPALRELMKVALGAGYDFAEAGDLAEALELVRSHVPTVVLLDVMLPGGSGLDVLRAVRAEPELASVRVIVVSAWQSGDDRRLAQELGADGFLGKPFELEELSAAVRALTHAEQEP